MMCGTSRTNTTITTSSTRVWVTTTSGASASLSRGSGDNLDLQVLEGKARIGEKEIASGKMSVPAAEQLIVGTGLNLEEAKSYTTDEIVALRWQDS